MNLCRITLPFFFVCTLASSQEPFGSPLECCSEPAPQGPGVTLAFNSCFYALDPAKNQFIEHDLSNEVIQGPAVFFGKSTVPSGTRTIINGDLLHMAYELIVEGELIVYGDYKCQRQSANTSELGASNGALLIRNGGLVRVYGDFTTDSLYAHVDGVNQSNSNHPEGLLATGGKLILHGDFEQQSSVASTTPIYQPTRNFAPQEDFEVILVGTTLQCISFEDPSNSYFQKLQILNNAGVKFLSPVTVKDQFDHRGNPVTVNHPNESVFQDSDNDGLLDHLDDETVVIPLSDIIVVPSTDLLLNDTGAAGASLNPDQDVFTIEVESKVPGECIVLEKSPDLTNWTEHSTLCTPSEKFHLNVLMENSDGMYYRVRKASEFPLTVLFKDQTPNHSLSTGEDSDNYFFREDGDHLNLDVYFEVLGTLQPTDRIRFAVYDTANMAEIYSSDVPISQRDISWSPITPDKAGPSGSYVAQIQVYNADNNVIFITPIADKDGDASNGWQCPQQALPVYDVVWKHRPILITWTVNQAKFDAGVKS